jgi:hypothetical protein
LDRGYSAPNYCAPKTATPRDCDILDLDAERPFNGETHQADWFWREQHDPSGRHRRLDANQKSCGLACEKWKTVLYVFLPAGSEERGAGRVERGEWERGLA